MKKNLLVRSPRLHSLVSASLLALAACSSSSPGAMSGTGGSGAGTGGPASGGSGPGSGGGNGSGGATGGSAGGGATGRDAASDGPVGCSIRWPCTASSRSSAPSFRTSRAIRCS